MKRARTRQPAAARPSHRQRPVATRKSPAARTEPTGGEFARFFDQSLDLLCIAGLDGYFEYVNPAWTADLGWSLEELKDRPFLDFVHPDDHAATRAEVGKLARGLETIVFENRYRHQDGSFRWLQWNARLEPERLRIYATARDVTRPRQLEREVLEVVDRERERLGIEIHDGLCQSLAGIAALSATLSRRLAAASDPAGSAASREITKLLNESIAEAHDLAHGLGPIGITEGSLDGALENLALNVRHRFEVSCTLAWDPSFAGLRREAETHLFRIAQEALNNAVTHGRPRRIEIRLTSENGKGLLTVRDDGAGLPEEPRNPRGIGLHAMAYRARLIGGSLEVRRRARGGTVVTCAFPVPEDPGARENPEHAPDGA